MDTIVVEGVYRGGVVKFVEDVEIEDGTKVRVLVPTSARKAPKTGGKVPETEEFAARDTVGEAKAERVAQAFTYITTHPNQVIYKKGEMGREIYALVEGRVFLKDSEEIVARIEKPGMVFGEEPLFIARPRRTTAVSVGSSKLMVINDLTKAISSIPFLGMRLLKTLTVELHSATVRKVNLQKSLNEYREAYRGILGELERIYSVHQNENLKKIIDKRRESEPEVSEIRYEIAYKPGKMDYSAQQDKERIFRAGEVLFREGDQSKEVYILMNGKLGVKKDGNVVAVIGEQGSFVGEMSILSNSPRSATVEAIEDSTLLVIDDLAAAINKTPSIGIKLAQNLAKRVYSTTIQANEYSACLERFEEQYKLLVENLFAINTKFKLSELRDLTQKAYESHLYPGERKDIIIS
ncbi:MAG: cyclic nucleotide-binding domain-containing protein [bacterium]